ncbi:hypothetical protein MFLAVUS_001380 [Mucor flavus]|uniref:Uncharacterized protein n=1 Tax=Mucor flavus TaxID=439312 RepID=A0ABP9YMA3_9FUNG
MQIKLYTIAAIAACLATLTQASPIARRDAAPAGPVGPSATDLKIQQIKSNPTVQVAFDYLIRTILEVAEKSYAAPGIHNTIVPGATTVGGATDHAASPNIVASPNISAAPNAAPKVDAAKADTPKADAAKVDAPKADSTNFGGQPIVGYTAPGGAAAPTANSKAPAAEPKGEDAKKEEEASDVEEAEASDVEEVEVEVEEP